MLRNALITVGTIGLFAVAGCGDEDNGDGSSSGVAPNKQAKDLNQEEINAICKDRVDRFESVTKSSVDSASTERGLCVSAGLVTAFFVSDDKKTACETRRDQCIQDSSDAGSSPTTDDNDAGEQSPSNCPTVAAAATCDAAVSDINACSKAQVAEYQRILNKGQAYLDGLSCDQAGQPIDTTVYTDLISQTTMTADLPECTALLANCPFMRLSLSR